MKEIIHTGLQQYMILYEIVEGWIVRIKFQLIHLVIFYDFLIPAS